MSDVQAFHWRTDQIERIRQVIYQLASAAVEERRLAEETIRQMDPDDLRLLLHLFDYEEPAEMAHRRRVNSWAGVMAYCLGIPPMYLLMWFQGTSLSGWFEIFTLCSAAAYPAWVFWLAWYKGYGFLRSRAIREGIFGAEVRRWPLHPIRVSDALATVDDLALLPVLLRASLSNWCRVSVGRSLKRLLPRLTEADRRYLDEDAWTERCRISLYRISAGHYPELAIAVLKGIQNLHDTRWLSQVRRRTRSRARRLSALRMAAEECLRELEGKGSSLGPDAAKSWRRDH
ncbi:MAG TPA: hypothetical protein VFJ58_03355 [Armatimonadota bacterium]|nr:hypothetical protein [Armatimonadota bacterium]